MRTRALDALIRDFADNPNLLSDEYTVYPEGVHIRISEFGGGIVVSLQKAWTDGTDHDL